MLLQANRQKDRWADMEMHNDFQSLMGIQRHNQQRLSMYMQLLDPHFT